MTRGFSLYLDALRFGAAFVVLLSHFGYPRFTEGRWLWVRELNLGSDAVVLFFVLSGLVIAFSAQTKDATLGHFAFNRLTRILSVALPALVLGFVLDRIGAAQFPAIYAGPFYEAMPLGEQLLRGLTFSNEWAGLEARLGSNGPYWSLSYEVAYYILFAIAFYCKGVMRLGLLAIGALLAGVNILLLMPSWLLGVWVWNRMQNRALPAGVVAWLMICLPPACYVAALALGIPEVLRAITAELLAPMPPHTLRFSDEFFWNGFVGLGFALHLLGCAAVMPDTAEDAQARMIRWLAGGSLSLYLMHYPLLQFLGPGLPKSGLAVIDDMLLLGITLLACLAFAQVFERTLRPQRAALQAILLRGRQAASF